MRKRIPAEEAFQYYLSLGPSRSYDQVAAKYEMSLRGVTKCASKQMKSAMKGPIGYWRRNLYPHGRRSRSCAHNSRSVVVD